MLRKFWKYEFLKEYRQARTLQKWWKFVLSQLVLKYLYYLGNFWKIEFSKEYQQLRTLQKWWKFVLS